MRPSHTLLGVGLAAIILSGCVTSGERETGDQQGDDGNVAQEKTERQSQRQQRRVEGRVDRETDEAADGVVDRILDAIFD